MALTLPSALGVKRKRSENIPEPCISFLPFSSLMTPLLAVPTSACSFCCCSCHCVPCSCFHLLQRWVHTVMMGLHPQQDPPQGIASSWLPLPQGCLSWDRRAEPAPLMLTDELLLLPGGGTPCCCGGSSEILNHSMLFVLPYLSLFLSVRPQ